MNANFEQELLNEFLEETQENITTFEEVLLQIESDLESMDDDQINQLFRSMHTIKGSAGFFPWLEKLEKVAHKMEHVLDMIRKGKMQISSEITNVLFSSLDVMKEMVHAVVGGKKLDGFDTTVTEQEIEALLENELEGKTISRTSPTLPQDNICLELERKLTEYDRLRMKEALDKKRHIYEVPLLFEQDCWQENVSPMDREHDLDQLGEVISSAMIIPEISSLEDIDASFDLEMRFLMETDKSVEDILAIFNGKKKHILEVKSLTRNLLVDIHLNLTTDMSEIADELVLSKIEYLGKYQVIDQPSKEFMQLKVETATSFQNLQHSLEQLDEVDSVEIVGLAPQETAIEEKTVTTPPPPQPEKTIQEPQPVKAQESPASVNPPKEAKEEKEEKILNRALKQHAASSTLKVNVNKLDTLLNLVSELVIAKAQNFQLLENMQGKYPDDQDLSIAAAKTKAELDRITTELQETIMITRMIPIGTVFHRFERIIRDLSRAVGKQIQVNLEGEDTELDKKIIDEIGEPLTHLVRNSIDHGVESPEDRQRAGKNATGNITLKASYYNNNTYIEVIDDGKGLDHDAILAKALEKGLITKADAENLTEHQINQLIFLPGFSTAKTISNISGRGVGMDVVKSKMELLKGTISVKSTPGKGSRIQIKLPSSLAILKAMMVKVEEEMYAIPIAGIVETIRVFPAEINDIDGRETYNLRGTALNLFRLEEVLGLERRREDTKKFIVVVGYEGTQIGIIVDDLVGEQEIVVKPLSDRFKNVVGIAGSSILGDGTVALILDTGSLTRRIIEEEVEDVSLSGKKDMVKEQQDILFGRDILEYFEEVSDEESLKIIGFSMGGEEFAISIHTAMEVINPSRITRIPNTDDYVLGVINLRGNIVPILDLRKKFRFKRIHENVHMGKIIICRTKREVLGLLVDSITESIIITRHDIQNDLPLVKGIKKDMLQGTIIHNERFVRLLNVERVVI